MASTAEESVPIAELSFRVLQVPWEQATAQTAAAAVRRYLEQRHTALAGALEVTPGRGAVTLRARGEAPQEMLREAVALVRRWDLEEVRGAMEVDAAEFGIEVIDTVAEPGQGERELISSEVRYFPYPECEWFEMRDGRLTLSERRIVFGRPSSPRAGLRVVCAPRGAAERGRESLPRRVVDRPVPDGPDAPDHLPLRLASRARRAGTDLRRGRVAELHPAADGGEGMRRFAFARQARITHEREFRLIYRDGKRFVAFPLRFCTLRRADGQSRLGMAVSRKVGNAVARNRWKRAVRETFRLNRHRLAAPHDVVVSVAWDAARADVARVADAFETLIARLNAGAAEAPGK